MSCVRMLVVALLFAIIATVAVSQEMPEGRLMRFPDIYKDKIVFSYGGDLWLVARDGGVARRITSASRPGTVSQVLARRQVDRLHRRSTTATSTST